MLFGEALSQARSHGVPWQGAGNGEQMGEGAIERVSIENSSIPCRRQARRGFDP